MDNARERLIELLSNSFDEQHSKRGLLTAPHTADYLIANGVTVPKHGRWLPQILLGQRVWDCSECKTIGSPQWKICPVCEAKMDLPRITPNTEQALRKMGQQVHKGG